MTNKTKELYSGLIQFLCINSYRVDTFKSTVTVEKCNDEIGLLPNWMFRADMMSVILTGKRCFDVVYQRNDDAISSLVCTPMSEAVIGLEEKDSYTQHPYFSDIPNSTLALLAAGSITDSLSIDHDARSVSIKPILGFFRMPEPGENLIFPSKEFIEGHKFHEMISSVSHLLKRDRQPAPSLGR